MAISAFFHHFSHLQTGKEKMYSVGAYWAMRGNGSFGARSFAGPQPL